MNATVSLLGETRMMGVSPRGAVSRVMPDISEQHYLEAFDAHADALYRHACFRISDGERARDLVQETFMRVWDHLRGGGKIRHWRGFLFRILNNLIIDEYRKRRELSLDALLEDETRVTTDALLADSNQRDIEEAKNDAQLLERIRTHIDKLPDHYRSVVTLRFVEGFSPKEIAQVLSVSENVASVRIHRALERLKEACGYLDTQ